MKKLIALILITTMVFTGCSTKKEATTQDAKETTATENVSNASETQAATATTEATTTTENATNTDATATNQQTESSTDTEGDSEKIEITLPAIYMQGATQESLNQEYNPYATATLNEDGSVTLVMSKAMHAALVEVIGTELTNQLNAMMGTTDLPNVTAIEINDDFTEFNLTTTSTELSDEESFAALYPYILGKMYNLVNQTESNAITVNYKNADSGEVVYTSDSAELDALLDSVQ